MDIRLLAATAALVLSAASSLEAAERGKSKADAWIGRDASALLLQLRVDGGRVDIDEDDATGETKYTWHTWNDAWVETRTSGGGLSYGNPSEAGSVMVGETQGGGGVAGAPIYRAPTYSTSIQHASTHRCDVTFVADADGIVRRWQFEGSACGSDIKAPKR